MSIIPAFKVGFWNALRSLEKKIDGNKKKIAIPAKFLNGEKIGKR